MAKSGFSNKKGILSISICSFFFFLKSVKVKLTFAKDILMKSNFKGYKVSQYVQIFPAEAFISNLSHDFAVYCSLLTASGIMSMEALQSLSDWIYRRDPRINKQVVETCEKIIKEKLGCIWYV